MSKLVDNFIELLSYVNVPEDDRAFGRYLDLQGIVSEALEAVEIIDAKDVDIITVKIATLDEYNSKWTGFIPLTLHEFNLIRKVLNYA